MRTTLHPQSLNQGLKRPLLSVTSLSQHAQQRPHHPVKRPLSPTRESVKSLIQVYDTSRFPPPYPVSQQNITVQPLVAGAGFEPTTFRL